MAAKKERRQIKCRVTYTEGCSDRLTKALVDIYYSRKMRGESLEVKGNEEGSA